MNPRRFLSLAIAAASLLGLAACGTSNPTAGGFTSPAPTPSAASFVTPATVQTAAQLTTSTALSLGVQDAAERKLVAGYCYSAAHAIRSLATGTAPSVDEFQATIQQFGGTNVPPIYAALAGNLAALYSSFYPALVQKGDPEKTAKALAYLEALAAGVENGAKPYL